MTADQEFMALLKEQLRRSQQESVALQAICGFLLAELAGLKSNPRAYIDMASPALLGFAERLADVTTPDFTRCVETVARFAESRLAGRSPSGEQGA